MIEFKTPIILLLIPIVLGVVYLVKRKQQPQTFRFSSVQLVSGFTSSWKTKFRHFPFFLRLAALVLFVIALAGPRTVKEETINHSEGIDIVLAIDASGSMAGEDFQINGKRYNRLEIVKKVVSDFIENRKNDRIGLIAFAGVAYTVCPLTTDNDWIVENLNRIKLGLIQDGTAIGSALASSISRLKNSHAASKVIILLTDGMNNAGQVDPVSAAEAAKALGIKIYTIGAGTKGYVPFPQDFFGRKVYQNMLVDLDEETLKEIAKITDGKYFWAKDAESLKKIYEEIDHMEKTEIEEYGYKEYIELFDKFLLFALVLLALDILFSNTLFLRIP